MTRQQCYSELSIGSGRADAAMQQGKGSSRGKVERQQRMVILEDGGGSKATYSMVLRVLG